MNRHKFNALLASITILGACITTGISQAEELPIGEVTTKTPATSVEDSATVWDQTKEGSVKAWDKTKEVSGNAWDATKEGSVKAWDKTKQISGDAWVATKEGSVKAWDKTKQISSDAWVATKEGSANAWGKTKTTVQGWQETKPESETDSNQKAQRQANHPEHSDCSSMVCS
jgi:hypothetical protein